MYQLLALWLQFSPEASSRRLTWYLTVNAETLLLYLVITNKPSLILKYIPFNLGWCENFHSRKNEAGGAGAVHFFVYINEEGLES